MAKAKREMPNLANATQEFLIDEIARLRDEQKELEFLEGVYKESLKAKFQAPDGTPTPLTDNNKAEMAGKVFKGTKNVLEIQYVEQSRFDSAGFKVDHPDLYAKYQKVIAFNQFKLAPLESAS